MNVLKWLGLIVSLIGAGSLVYPILFKVSSEVLNACAGFTAYSMLWATVLFGVSGKKK